MVIRIELRISKQTVLAIGNEACVDYRISTTVQSRSQLS